MATRQSHTFLSRKDAERLTALEKALLDVLDDTRHEGTANEDEPAAKLAEQVHDDIGDALRTVESFDLDEQPGAAEKLPSIAKLASTLAGALNELCGSEHICETAARQKANGEEQAGESAAAEKIYGLSPLENRVIGAIRTLRGACQEAPELKEPIARAVGLGTIDGEASDSLAPARAVRAAMEAECEVMSVEEAAAELRKYQVDVHQSLAADGEYGDAYAVIWTCSEKGVRHALASARTLSALLPPE